MNNLYDYLNYVSTDEEFSPEPLTMEERIMIKKAVFGKKKSNTKKICTIAAAAALIAAVGITSYATGFIDNVIKTVTTGHNRFTVYSTTPEFDGMDMPKELQGLLYNEDGSAADRFFPNAQYFDASGAKIDDLLAFISEKGIDRLTTDDDTIAVELAKDGDDKDLSPVEHFKRGTNAVFVTSIDELNGKLDFAPAVPKVLPDGFKFAGAGCYEGSGLYLTLFYQNDKDEYVMIYERLINDETAYEDGAKKLEELSINGNYAVLLDDRSLDWESDGVSVRINGSGLLDRDTMIAMAESMYE